MLVSSKKHIKELSDAPELSQHAAFDDVCLNDHLYHYLKLTREQLLGFKENLNGLGDDERRSSTARLLSLVLQRVGPPQFSLLQPHLQTRLEKALSEALTCSRATDGTVS